MYGLCTYGIPTINDFAHAQEVYDSLATFPPRHRNSRWNYARDMQEARPLNDSARRLGHLSLRQNEDGDWCARYHNTDCVIYHASGDITIEPYDSKSTNGFVRAVAPSGFNPQFTDGRAYLLWVQSRAGSYEVCDNGWWHPNGEFMQTDDDAAISTTPIMRAVAAPWHGDFTCYEIDSRGARFRKDSEGYWKPVSGTNPVNVPTLDTRKATTMRKQFNTSAFFAWFKAASHMGGIPKERLWAHDDVPSVCEGLSSSDYYPVLAYHMKRLGEVSYSRGWRHDNTWSFAKFKRGVLARLYRETDCINEETVACYANDADFKRIRKLSDLYDV